jgi:glycosyltransferase involved in cell wall biosynthesis
MKKLTAIIPAGNELHNINDVLDSVSFADEILVIDSYSDDGTYEIALKKATKVFRRKYDNSASQKNWIIPHASHEWILLVDADERVTEGLKAEIKQKLLDTSNDYVAYWIGRNNHFMGQKVKYSGWQNDKVIRLFKRDHCRYEEKNVHEEIITNGKIGKLKNKFYHNTYTTIDNYIEKMNRYAWLQAIDYNHKTGMLTPYHFIIKPIWRFFKHYLIQGGFRDGTVGVVISYIQAYSVFMRYVKMWLIRHHLK